MRHPHLAIAAACVAAVIACASPAAAQSSQPRITVTAMAGHEQVSVDGGEGFFLLGGAAMRVRVMRFMSAEGEITKGTGEIFDSYQGVFTSLAGPGSSREEIERLGVVLKRERRWTPGVGLAFALVFHTPPSQRVGVSASLGLGGRGIAVAETRTLISLPAEWPANKSTGAGGEHYTQQHGGPFLTLAMPVNVTPHFAVIPEARWSTTLADETYSTTRVSLQAGWRF